MLVKGPGKMWLLGDFPATLQGIMSGERVLGMLDSS